MSDVFGWIGQQLLQLVLPSLATAAAALAVGLLKRQLSKVGLDIDEKQETRIRQIVHDAIVRTEEVARRDPTMTSAEKADFTERSIREAEPAIGPAQARAMIDTMLPIVRAKGIGAKPVAIPLSPVPSTPATFGQKKPS